MATASYNCGAPPNIGSLLASPENDGNARFYGAEIAFEDFVDNTQPEFIPEFNANGYYKKTPNWDGCSPTEKPSGWLDEYRIAYRAIDINGQYKSYNESENQPIPQTNYNTFIIVYKLTGALIGAPVSDIYLAIEQYDPDGFFPEPKVLFKYYFDASKFDPCTDVPVNKKDEAYWTIEYDPSPPQPDLSLIQPFARDIRNVQRINPTSISPLSECDPPLTLGTKKELLLTYNTNSNSVISVSKKLAFSYIVRNSASKGITRRTRTNLSFCAFRSNMYIIGGGPGESGKYVEYYIYNQTNRKTGVRTGPFMVVARRDAVYELYNNKIYAISGIPIEGSYLDNFEILNVNSTDFTWKIALDGSGSEMLLPGQFEGGPAGIAYAQSGQINYGGINSIIIVGGTSTVDTALTIPVVYNEIVNEWKRADETYVLRDVAPDLVPIPDNSPSVITTEEYLRISTNTAYYQLRELEVIPGWRGYQPFMNYTNVTATCNNFRRVKDSWSGVIQYSDFPPKYENLPEKSSLRYIGNRVGHSITKFKGKTLVIGGHHKTDTISTDDFIYLTIFSLEEDSTVDLSENIKTRWKYYTCLPTPRAGHTSISYNYLGKESLFIIGGLEGTVYTGGVSSLKAPPVTKYSNGNQLYQPKYNKGHVDKDGNYVWPYYNISSPPIDPSGVITWPTKDAVAPTKVIYYDGTNWITLRGELNYQRIEPRSVIFVDRIYVIGGRDPTTNLYIDTPEYYDIQRGIWILDLTNKFNHSDGPGAVVTENVVIPRE